MRLFTQTIAFALALRAFAVLATSASSCKTLSDKSSPFVSSVAQLNGVSPEQLAALPLDAVLAPVDANFPWFSKCVANVNLVDVVMAMYTSQEVGQCLQALEASNQLTFTHDAISSDAVFSDDFCPMVVDTAVPCLNDVFLPVFAQALSTAGGCCSDMNAVITASFGSDMQRLVARLSKLMVNTACSVKSTTNSEDVGEITETCGHSLLKSFAGRASNDLELLTSLAAAAQIPEDSVCAAVEGDPFKTTTGGRGEFVPLPGAEPFGICYATMQNLVAYVKSFPIWSTLSVETDAAPWLQKLSDLFAPGTCVRGDYLLHWALDEDSIVTKALDLLDGLGAVMSIKPPHDGSSSADAGAGVGDSASTSGSTDESSNSTASASSSASEEESDDDTDPATAASDSSSDATIAVVSFEPQASSPDALVSSAAEEPATDATTLSTASIIRAALSPFVEPLAAVCLHFPSATACDFGEDEIAFAFSDVGRLVAPVKTPAKTTATAASTTTTPEPTTDAPVSAATGDMSAAVTVSRQTGLVAVLALTLAAAGLA